LVNAAWRAKRAGRRWLFVAFFFALLGFFVVLPLSHRPPEPPHIDTTTLDPAVARTIDNAVRQVRATPKSGDAWGRLGATLLHYEFNRESADSFVQAERSSPDDPRWYYLHALLQMNHEPSSAEELLKKSAERAPETIDMPRLRLASLLAERGKQKAAELEFRRLLKRERQHAAASLGLSRLLHQQGHDVESVTVLQSSLRDLRTRKAAQELLATVQGSLGQTNEARATAQTAVGLPTDVPWPDPYWDEATKYRVGLKHSLEQSNGLLDSGRATEAVALLQIVTRDYPADPEGWYLLGWALNQTQAFVESERALREHLRLSTNSVKGLTQLAVALLGQRRFADALPVLEDALKLKPTWRELHANLGYACVQLGRAEEAERHYRDALAQDPNHVPSRIALGELLLRRGEVNQARQVLQEAANLAPNDPKVQGLLRKLP
jgi:tetratricopeptide (TPR) repeat protein